MLLSGTPLQNNVEELFSLLNFLEPEQFKSSVEFMGEFGNLQTEGQVDKLKAVSQSITYNLGGIQVSIEQTLGLRNNKPWFYRANIACYEGPKRKCAKYCRNVCISAVL